MIWFGALILSLLTQAFFSGCETGFVSLQRPRIHNACKQGSKRAAMVDFFLRDPSLTLAVTLLGTNISVVCSSILGKRCALWSGMSQELAFVVVPLALTLIMLVIEIIPKNWFRQAPDERLIIFAPLLYIAYIILYPPAKILAIFTKFTVKLFTRNSDDGKDPGLLLREDFRLLLRDSEQAGIIDSEAANILDRSVDFYKLKIADIMTPLEQVKYLTPDTTVAEAVAICRNYQLSRLIIRHPQKNEKEVVKSFFSIYDAIFALDEELWPTVTVQQLSRRLTTVFADESVTSVITHAENNNRPLLAVIDRINSCQLGVVTPIDVARQIFS